MARTAEVQRKTTETDIFVKIDLDGEGKSEVDTTLPFLDHMLVLLAGHSLVDMSIKGRGDTDVDDHHLVEDLGLCLGEAFKKALDDKKGIRRYGTAFIPMDESLSHVSIDLSGRPSLVYNVTYEREKVKNFELLQLREFFKAFADRSGMTLHINTIYGSNFHHSAESVFKAVARALREAVAIDDRVSGVLSTKGVL